MELVVYKNRWYTVGDHGAEFATIPKGAIVFNHKQTEELFANGRVTSGGGRGTVFANGTAYASGTAFAEGSEPVSFDWIETLVSRLERAMNNLESTIDSTHRSWKSRNAALDKMIYRIDDEIAAQESAQDYYSGKADTALADLNSYAKNQGYMGHDQMYWTKVINGRIDTDDIDDEKLAEKIQAYKDWYEKALEAEDAVIELSEKKMDTYAQYFDNVISEYDGTLQIYEHKASMIDEYINQTEAKGHLVSGDYYQALIDNNNGNVIPTLQNKYDDLVAERAQYINNVAQELMSQGMGKLEAYQNAMNSEEADRMLGEIYAVEEELEKAKTETLEWQNEIRQLNWDSLDLAREKMSQLNDEADFFIELMSNDKLFDDNGQMNEKGLTTMALHFANRDIYAGKAKDYADEINDIDTKISTGELDETNQYIIERRQELVEAQRECILAAEQEEDAIKDLISEGYDKQLEALQDRIDLYEESIQSAKDLYDYEKNISEQVQNIASLEKQLHAYEGFNDEETRATVQKLKVELEKANADLEEAQYDKFISDQSALLDELYLEYETSLNERLDNDVALLQEKLGEVNNSLGKDGAIVSTLSGLAGDVGVEMSEEFANIWDENGKGDSIADSVGSISGVLTDIKGDVAILVGKSDTEANTNIGSGGSTSSGGASTSGSSGSGSGSGSGGNKSTGDGKPKIGDKVKFLNGKYYYDSQGVNPAGSKNHGKQVYITNINKKSWATHPYHISTGKKLGQGDLGWLKLNQISGYATGKKNFSNNEIAWTQEKGQEFIVRPSDGAILTPIARKGSVLNAQASENLWNMTNSPAEFIKDNLNLGATNVPNNSTAQSVYHQTLDKVVFNLPNVKNYEELLSAMQKDKNFERLISAMTIDRIAGGSSLAKNKSIRK